MCRTSGPRTKRQGSAPGWTPNRLSLYSSTGSMCCKCFPHISEASLFFDILIKFCNFHCFQCIQWTSNWLLFPPLQHQRKWASPQAKRRDPRKHSKEVERLWADYTELHDRPEQERGVDHAVGAGDQDDGRNDHATRGGDFHHGLKP